MSAKTTDASLWRWSVITTPILASAALFAGGALLDQLRVGPWFVVPVAVCAVVGTIVASHKADLGRFASTYAALAVAGSGAWLVWVSASTAWSTTAITVLLCGLVVLGPMWFLARHAQHRKRLRDLEEERRKQIAAEAQRWPDILAALGMPGVTLLEKVSHGGVGSYSLHLRLPVNGRVRFGVLKTRTEELEIAAGLRYGALNVERGDTAADVWLHVNEIDVLAQTIPLPKDSAPLTISRPLPLGLYENGTVLEVLMQGRASKTVGLRGKGKSNLINAKISALTRCVDVVVWIMDNKGGRTARPWLLPWLEGRTHRPVLDWVATTKEENTRMLKAAVAVIEYRSNSGIGGDKIIPTARMTLYGLRRGEVLGLRWSDIDLAAKTLTVRQARLCINYRTRIEPPKSENGVRTLPLDDDLVAALKKLRRRQELEHWELGEEYAAGVEDRDWYVPGDAYLVRDASGIPVHPQWYSDEFDRLIQQAKLPRIRLHDSRHTALSPMEKAGVPISIISRWAGHCNPAFTMRTYVHANDEDLVVGAQSLGELYKAG